VREADRIFVDADIEAVARGEPGVWTTGRSQDALKRDEKR
jgi:hypothetical protein